MLKLALLLPALIPLTCHWYEGLVPPLPGVAVHVTAVPLQMVVAVAEMITVGATVPLTVIVIILLLTIVGDAQVALLVIMTLT